jgi:hypothetical protein
MDEIGKPRITDPTFYDDPGPAMQAAAERHLELVWAAFYRDEEDEEQVEGEEIESPAVGPFCGCETCTVREVLAGAWPLIEAYFAGREAPGARAGES